MFTLGVVPYLNAVPLTVCIPADEATCVAAVPSRLAGLVERDQVDAALLPVAEAIRGVGDGYVGRFGITSEGAVASVLLFLRRPLGEVRHMVLDPASRTSAALARHLVVEAAGEGVRIERAGAPGPDPLTTEADAVLVIGDPALAARKTWDGAVLDLGTAWTARTGLPFVYARWTARRGLGEAARQGLAACLDRSATAGLAVRDSAARAWAVARGEDPDAAANYVGHHVGYAIEAREESGLALFAEIVKRQGPAAPSAGGPYRA